MWDRLIYAFWAIRIFWPVGTFLQFTLFFQTPEKPLKRTFTSKGRVFTDSFKLEGIVNKPMSYAVLPRITIPFPLSGFKMTMSLFLLILLKMLCVFEICSGIGLFEDM